MQLGEVEEPSSFLAEPVLVAELVEAEVDDDLGRREQRAPDPSLREAVELDSKDHSYLDAVVGVLAAERLVEEEAVQGWFGRPTIGRFTS